MTEPFRQEGEKLIYGPYHDVPPFKVQMLSVHFAHNNRFATVKSGSLMTPLEKTSALLGDESDQGGANLGVGENLCRGNLRNSASSDAQICDHERGFAVGEYRSEVNWAMVPSRLHSRRPRARGSHHSKHICEVLHCFQSGESITAGICGGSSTGIERPLLQRPNWQHLHFQTWPLFLISTPSLSL